MTRKTVPVFVLIAVLIIVPLSACNRSAAPDVIETEDELMQEAASEAETEEATEEVTEEPTEEATEEATPTEEPTEEATPTEEPTEEATEEATEEPTEEVTEEPTEEATEEPTVEAPTGQHVVKPGENLFRIALRYGTTVETLATVNGITNPSLIYVGQVLTIPGDGTPSQPGEPGEGDIVHVVQPGENLFRIALKYNYDYYYLARYNNISNPSLVYVGQKIYIPSN